MRIENIKNKYIILVVMLLLTGWFYWFQWRPARIRAYCHKWVVDLPGEVEKFRYKGEITEYEALYEQCLHDKGLK